MARSYVPGLILALLGIVGLFMVLLDLVNTSSPEKFEKALDFRIVVSGRVLGKFENTQKNTYILRLPALPWQKQFEGRELLDDTGHFEATIELECRSHPGELELWVSSPGKKKRRLTRHSLDPSEDHLDLESLNLEN